MGALFDHFYVVGVGASVMLGLLLTVIVVRQKRADKGPNRMMAVLVLVLMFSVMLNSFLSSFVPQAYPNLLAFPEPFLLLIGPLFPTSWRYQVVDCACAASAEIAIAPMASQTGSQRRMASLLVVVREPLRPFYHIRWSAGALLPATEDPVAVAVRRTRQFAL